jgi:hypothetical protein
MATCPGLWHRHAEVAYLAVFLGMIGHATSEFVAVCPAWRGRKCPCGAF